MSNDSNALVKKEENLPISSTVGVFSSILCFEDAQRMAKPLATSQLVPTAYRNRIDDCLIALEIAQRIGASPLGVLQNLYIVHGKPAWSSQFLIACINASGKFSPVRYKMTGTKGKPTYGCIAWAKDIAGEVLESPEVTLAMAEAEGWSTKAGSKWKAMPELMLRYRAATLFARLYAPELTMGIRSADEVIDISPVVTEPSSRFESAPEPAPQVADEIEDEIPMDFPTPPDAEVEPEAPQPPKRQLLTRRPPVLDTTGFELDLHTWLSDHNAGVSGEQIKAICGRDNVPFDSNLFENDAQTLKSLVKTIKGQ